MSKLLHRRAIGHFAPEQLNANMEEKCPFLHAHGNFYVSCWNDQVSLTVLILNYSEILLHLHTQHRRATQEA